MADSGQASPVNHEANPGVISIVSPSGFGTTGFIVFVASAMALNALGIDSMLQALPAIGDTFEIQQENDRQWIIGAFLLGFGLAQIIWGPLADRFGRKPLIIFGLSCYAVTNLLAGLADSFPTLLLARLLAGVSASATRVILISIVRDCYAGRRMARVMSLAIMMIYLIPMLAPSIGQIIELTFGTWRAIFFTLSAYAVIVGACGVFRLRETLHPEFRRPLSFATAIEASGRVFRDRAAFGYTMASAFAFACVSGFVMSVEQIFADTFKNQALFPVLFACIGACMAIAAFLNARFVEHLGMRRISHAALIIFIVLNGLHATLVLWGTETLYSFVVLQGMQMFFYGLLGSNFNSMAMEPVGDIAGSASSVQGFLSTCIGAGVGAVVGQCFDGTTLPLSIGFLGCSVLCLAFVLYAETGQLFRPHHPNAAKVISFE